MTRTHREPIQIVAALPGTRAVFSSHLTNDRYVASPVLLWCLCECYDVDEKGEQVGKVYKEVCGMESMDDAMMFCESMNNFKYYLAPGEKLEQTDGSFEPGTPG